MYKLVIVEDEKDVRSRLVGMIGKSSGKFQVISEYETGIDAYDGIVFDNPDLIITDIKIPYINGIDLAKEVRKVFPLIKIIVITGYSEFDYAKESANLGVVGFISKPITSEELTSLLAKAEAALDSDYLTAKNLNQLTDFYEKNLPIIRENDLYRLSNMTDVSAAFDHKLKSNNINLDYRYFVMCVFDFDAIREGGEERFELAFSSIRKIIEEDFIGLYECDMFNRYEKLCLIIKSDNPPDITRMSWHLERIIQRVGRYSNMPVSVGLSAVYENKKNFSAMLKEAVRALRDRAVMGGSGIFLFKDLIAAGTKISVDDGMIRELGYMLYFKPIEDCVNRIDDIWGNVSDETVFYTSSSILNVLIKSCDDLDGINALSGGLDSLYRRLLEMKDTNEICNFLKKLTRTIRDLNDGIITGTLERNLRKIVLYLETHFCDPGISFDSLASELNLSVSYISILLKKKLNTSFVKMLTSLRMEKAKALLTDSSLKIIDVAEQLGYSDSYYFSHCFKKYTGVSPKEFKNL